MYLDLGYNIEPGWRKKYRSGILFCVSADFKFSFYLCKHGVELRYSHGLTSDNVSHPISGHHCVGPLVLGCRGFSAKTGGLCVIAVENCHIKLYIEDVVLYVFAR